MKDFTEYLNLPSPVQEVDLHGMASSSYSLHVKREDLIHPDFGGNKWRKLFYNLKEFESGGYTHLVTMGGPFSNHIAATAQICLAAGYPCVGIIRGTQEDLNNPTLLKAKSAGMEIIHISKAAYRKGKNTEEVKGILSNYPKPYFVPEGGSNRLAMQGVGELMFEVTQGKEFYDKVIVAAGTGATAAGIIKASKIEVIVINVLKNIGLQNAIEDMLEADLTHWQINHNYHFGGFAKTSNELISFINKFKLDTGIPLDPVYTGKAMYATLDLIAQNQLSGKRILFIHTGGLQGITAYNYLNSNKRQLA